MSDNPPELTDAEREFLARSGADPAKHAAIRDLPTNFGGRSVADITAAIRRVTESEETDR